MVNVAKDGLKDEDDDDDEAGDGVERAHLEARRLVCALKGVDSGEWSHY